MAEYLGRCEGCGVPFYEGDSVAMDEEGCMACLPEKDCYSGNWWRLFLRTLFDLVGYYG